MIVDRTHVRWAVFFGLALVAATALYVRYVGRTTDGPSGGSYWGLVFAATGTACILFAALLGVRKRRPHYRWGRVAWWLKGHLWLGALSLPLVLFHGGFSFGGTLTQILMWIFLLVFATGIVGIALQQVLPRFLTKSVPQETVYEQIDHVRRQLFHEAEELAKGDAKGGGRGVSRAKEGGKVQGRVVESRAATAEAEPEAPAPEVDLRAALKWFVDRDVRVFFARRGTRNSPLRDPQRRTAMLTELKQKLDPSLHAAVDDLGALCETRAQLEVQRRIHVWLHTWLLVHVPLSWTMILLTAIHAVVSLYY
jgi:hypothetical protein